MVDHKNIFQLLMILVTVTLIAIATINNISSIKIGDILAEKGFSPNPVNIKSGDNVTWVNDDTILHTITYRPFYGGETGKLFDSGLFEPTALTTRGKTFSHIFTEKGQYPYFCQLHPTMVGKVSIS